MIKDFDKGLLLNLANMTLDKDKQVQIATLSDELTISQVVKFFQRQGKSFTKTMIQNYVRVGVLPPPVDKRYYTKDHLILLTLIDSFKAIYSLEEIKAVLTPIRNNPDIFEDDIVKASEVYRNYLILRKEALDKWKEALPQRLDRINVLLEESGVKGEEGQKASSFMVALTIMAETIAMKDLINELIKVNE